MSKFEDESVSNEDAGLATDCSSTESTATGSTESGGQGDSFEDGFDVQTHGGGSLENVEGFSEFETMVENIGSTEAVALPGDATIMPCATTLEFGEPAESVCGVDDRQQINTLGNLPWRMICQLIMTHSDGRRSRGTGWFISPRTVMTAGHCVFSRSAGGWAESIEIIPAMNGTNRPFGSATSTDFRSVNGWVKDKQVSHDYGCIILPETSPLGDKTGWFGFSNLSDQSLENLLANNSGYPGDKTFGTQWYNAGRISNVTPKRLHYMIDTAPGQSGSPMWRYNTTTKKRHVVGIHNYGGCANKSTRINDAVYTNMQKWKSLGA